MSGVRAKAKRKERINDVKYKEVTFMVYVSKLVLLGV